MKKHADLIRPKFEIAYQALEKLDKDIGEYSRPTGGYFITFTSQKPIASNIVDLCKEAGVLHPQELHILMAKTLKIIL